MRTIELLAPARDAATAIAAIEHGADAVYIGGPDHGARAAATNTVEDIRRVAEYGRRFGAKVYVTLNTLVYDSEIEGVERLVGGLYHAGVDALIVQDLSLLKMKLPPIDLHASTQCDIRDTVRARFLRDCGFSRVVVAREMGADGIAELHRELPDVEIEAFVHGALCVSYSGDCRASLYATGRSANRGECAQVCRMAFSLVDGEGKTVIADKHLLSLRDMNRSESLEAMIDAGVTSFKIEGRLKDTAYVKNTVAAYRRMLDAIIDRRDDLQRASAGRTRILFEPDLRRSFNRGFTPYFLNAGDAAAKIANFDSPKSIGVRVGTVAADSKGRTVAVRTTEKLNNGDGLVFFDRQGRLDGFRVNRAEPGRVIAARDVSIKAGTPIYRNRDTARDAMLAGNTARRTIDITMKLRRIGDDRLCLDVSLPELGLAATSALTAELKPSRTSQLEARRRVLIKTGDTPFVVTDLEDTAGDIFMPASQIVALRRRAISRLLTALAVKSRRRLRRPFSSPRVERRLPLSANVANRLARELYAEAGARDISDAAELRPRHGEGNVAMTCRYCLRRELDACLKTPAGEKLCGPLKLTTASGISFILDFDCKNCMMRLLTCR